MIRRLSALLSRRSLDPADGDDTARLRADEARNDRIGRAGANLLAAIAYGDAAGAPYEGEPAQEINPKQLIAYNNPLFGPVPVGGWTDDTQLSVAVARALVASNQFDLGRIAAEHLSQLHVTPKTRIGDVTVVQGWGPSTVAAVDRYRRGTAASEAGTPDGAGNGVLMKMAPLAWWQSAQNTSDATAVSQWDALTAFTHRSPVAQVCTRVHGTVLRHLLDNPDPSPADTIAVAIDAARDHERALGAPPHTSSELAFLATCTPGACEHTLRDHVCRLSPYGQNLYGFYAPETLAVAYGALLQWGTVDRTLADVVFNVISLGGDTDSTASIFAAMVVFATGGAITAPEDLHEVRRVDDLRELSARLAATAAGAH